MKKINLVFVLVIAFALFICASGVVSAAIYVPDDYAKIQWAADNASARDTIINNYYKHVAVSDKEIANFDFVIKPIETSSSSGDWVVNTTETRSDEMIVLNGHLTIQSGGNLALHNVTLLMNCNYDGQYHIEVQDGGELYIFNNSNITAVNPDYKYCFRVRNGSMFEMRDSEVHYCGYVVPGEDWDGLTGMWIGGDNAIINGNQISENGVGIYLSAKFCTISNNTITNNTYHGIAQWSAHNNTITNNEITFNGNCGIGGNVVSNSTINDNTISNNNGPGIYLGREIDRSTFNTISNNTVNLNYVGIYLNESWNTTLLNNNCSSSIYGIFLINSSHIIVENNTANNNTGFEGDEEMPPSSGILLGDSSHCIIKANSASSNIWGIAICNSTNTKIENNTVSNNNDTGIFLYSSCNNALTNNVVQKSTNGVALTISFTNDVSFNTVYNTTDQAIVLDSSCDNILSSNNASNNQGEGFLIMNGSNNNVLCNNIASSNDEGGGICLFINASNNTVSGNYIQDNTNGIAIVSSSSHNHIARNTVLDNSNGIFLQNSSNNNIHLINFINNTNNVFSYNSTNIWNSTEKITYTYNGSQYTNYMGNYWDDYKEKYPNAKEIDECGIWDTPYSINSDQDYYPLMKHFENYFIPTENIFDTGSPANPYPSIFGTHNGTIKPNQTITASKLYTYPCAGTGGHTEYARIWNSTLDVVARWSGYKGDWHNITFNETFVLYKNKTYNYTIRTGSYPQIIHTDEWEAEGGMGIINCTSFVDANGKIYNDWIPAIRLE